VNLPDGYVARGATREDLDQLVELVGAGERHDFGTADPARGEILYDWGRVGFDLARDARFMVAPGGVIAGYGQVVAYDPSVQVLSWVHVHPEQRGRGIGHALLGWAEDHAKEKLVAGSSAPFRTSAPAGDLAARALLRQHGFTHVRSDWQMERELSPDEEAVPAPDGIAIRASAAELDDRALYRVSDESFRDHFGYQHYPFDDWRKEFQGIPEYDSTLVFIAEEGPEPVGLTIALIDEGIGWVAELGVRWAWRGRGIGRALLARSFAELARRDIAIVRLSVDAANTTGATRLYERAGMSLRREWHVYEKEISRDRRILLTPGGEPAARRARGISSPPSAGGGTE
jgi:mycothiol synthase